MLETIIKLLERFVVAHELIAANSAKQPAEMINKQTGSGETLKEEATDNAKEETAKSKKAKPEEDDLADDDEPEEKPKRKPRQTKPKAEPEPDLNKIRDELVMMAQHIGSGDSDECDNEFQDLLDEYDVRSVKKLGDLQVQEFHKELKAIVAKYYDIEE